MHNLRILKYTAVLIWLLLSLIHFSSAQETEETVYTTQTFYGTRVMNGHSTETTPKGKLELRLQHRMGRLDQGVYELFGLDQAAFRFGFEYGITDWLMVGTGRATTEKFYDGFVKAKILRQSTGKKNMPVSLLAYAGIGLQSTRWPDDGRNYRFSSRLSYVYQLIIGRKFIDRIGIQLAPTLVHRNLVVAREDHNDIFALGVTARVRFSRRAAFAMEYYWVPKGQIYSDYKESGVRDNFSAGVEIFTGKHVFEIFLTNGIGMTEKQFITQSTEDWFRGVRIGFNMTRLFTLVQY